MHLRRYQGLDRPSKKKFRVNQFFHAFVIEALPVPLDICYCTIVYNLVMARARFLFPWPPTALLTTFFSSWSPTLINLLWLFTDSGRAVLSPWELLAFDMLYAGRMLIISLKYGFFMPEDISAMMKGPPHWTDAHTAAKTVSAMRYDGDERDEMR